MRLLFQFHSNHHNSLKIKKKVAFSDDLSNLAERWGFEPQIETSPITDFESAAFDHSAIFPYFYYTKKVLKSPEK